MTKMNDMNEFQRLKRKAEKRFALEFWISILVITGTFFALLIIKILWSE